MATTVRACPSRPGPFRQAIIELALGCSFLDFQGHDMQGLLILRRELILILLLVDLCCV